MWHNETWASDILHKIYFKKSGSLRLKRTAELFDLGVNTYKYLWRMYCNFSLLTRCYQGKDASHITPQVNKLSFHIFMYFFLQGLNANQKEVQDQTVTWVNASVKLDMKRPRRISVFKLKVAEVELQSLDLVFITCL